MTSYEDKADDLWQRMYGDRGLTEGQPRTASYSRDQKPPPMLTSFADRRSDPAYVHRDRTDRTTLPGFTLDIEQVERLMQSIGAAFTEFAQGIAKVATSLFEFLERVGALDGEPTDPRVRALHMRQHRNTGPDNRPSLDGRRRAKR